MFCENPQLHISKKTGREYLSKCGKCRACRAVKSNDKTIRGIFAASEFNQKGQFLTLTYNDEHKPDGLQHSDFSNFMKKLRQNTGVKDLKMFMAGEYGETGEEHREHFHVLFFNHRFPIEEIQKAWTEPRKRGRKKLGQEEEAVSLGFVYDGTCTPQAVKYCSGYVAKGGYDPESHKRPPYGRFSCGLPDNLSIPEIHKMCKTGRVDFNGRSFCVPELWKRKYKELWSGYRARRGAYRLIHRGYEEKQLTPSFVSAIMDQRELEYSLKKAKKKAKRSLGV